MSPAVQHLLSEYIYMDFKLFSWMVRSIYLHKNVVVYDILMLLKYLKSGFNL
jgi:hypothetical protein